MLGQIILPRIAPRGRGLSRFSSNTCFSNLPHSRTMEERLPCAPLRAKKKKNVLKRGNWRLKRFPSATPEHESVAPALQTTPRSFTLASFVRASRKRGLTTGLLANNMRGMRHNPVKIHHLHSLVRTYRILTVSGVFNKTAKKTWGISYTLGV